MDFAGVIRIGAILHYCNAIITANALDLDSRNRPDEHEKILQLTDKFGREPYGQEVKEETESENPNYVSGKFKPVLTRYKDKDKSKNEINAEGTQAVPSSKVYPPATPSDISAALYNTILGENFCGAKLPESRICDPHDILGVNEGIVWVFLM